MRIKQDSFEVEDHQEFTVWQLVVHFVKWITLQTEFRHGYHGGPLTHYYYYPNRPGLDDCYHGRCEQSPVYRRCNICNRTEMESERETPGKPVPSFAEELYNASKKYNEKRGNDA